MGEILLRKCIQARDRVEKIRRALPLTPEEVLTDERLEAFLSFNLFLLVQDALDLAAHVIAARGLAVPGSHRESFEALAAAGMLRLETASAMASMGALRNRIAHAYGDIDPVRMVREAPVGLDVVSRFLDEITQIVAGDGSGRARS